jgi:hypothetical protein
MFYERLLSLFWEHASFYRAITVDEYKDRWVDYEFHKMEYDKICGHWNKAVLNVFPGSAGFSVEYYDVLALMGWEPLGFSGWEIESE